MSEASSQPNLCAAEKADVSGEPLMTFLDEGARRAAPRSSRGERGWVGNMSQGHEGYRRIFENATEGIYRSSPDGTQVRANPALVKLNGYETEAAMLEQVNSIAREWYVEPERRTEFQRLLMAQGRVENFESEIYRHKTRERIWVSENAWLVRDALGEVLYYEGTVEDITVRKRFEIFRDVLMEFVEDTLQRGLDQSFYQRLLERTVSTVPDAQAGSILLKDAQGCFCFVAAVNFDLAGLQKLVFYPHEFLIDLKNLDPQRVYDYDSAPLPEAERQHILETSGRVKDLKTSLSVPIALDGEVIAFLHLNNFETENAFSDEDLDLTKLFARQVAALLKRLKLETELRTRQSELERWATFRSELNHFMVETLEQGFSDTFYQRLLDHAARAIPGAEAGSILVKNAHGDYEFVATLNYDLEALRKVTFKPHELIEASSDKPLVADNLAEHCDEVFADERLAILIEVGRLNDIKSFLSLPVVVGGEVVAALNLDAFSLHAFSEEATLMADTFATQIGVVLQRLRLEETLAATNRKLAKLANFDPLTGLPNRALFTDRLGQALLKAERHKGGVGLLFLDLDGFKLVNDSLGHSVGDTLLGAVGDRLKSCIREGDTVARLGGDEFTLILNTLTNAEDAALVAQKVLDTLSAPFYLNGRAVHVGASIGITTYPQDGADVEHLVKHADTAMYHAKHLGKNRYHFFTQELNSRVLEQLHLEGDLRRALDTGDISLAYQSRVHLTSGRMTSVEALARWNHPERGPVSPAVFIPLAERTGLIHKLGRLVLVQACRQARAWQQAGKSVRVAVNLSVKQLQQENIVADVAAVLAETGLPAGLLELEITESAAMSDVETNIDTLTRLRNMGVYLSVDDFGTAYSSLNYLKRLPINSLKIDQSFVRDIGVNAADAAIVRAVVALGKSMNFTLIAEGVETEHQLTFLRDLACDEAQGYLFSRPKPAEDFAADRKALGLETAWR